MAGIQTPNTNLNFSGFIQAFLHICMLIQRTNLNVNSKSELLSINYSFRSDCNCRKSSEIFTNFIARVFRREI